jgi:hypothetical protein
VLTQGVADIEVLTGDFDLHGRRKYPCFALSYTHGRVWLARQLACQSCPELYLSCSLQTRHLPPVRAVCEAGGT